MRLIKSVAESIATLAIIFANSIGLVHDVRVKSRVDGKLARVDVSIH